MGKGEGVALPRQRKVPGNSDWGPKNRPDLSSEDAPRFTCGSIALELFLFWKGLGVGISHLLVLYE